MKTLTLSALLATCLLSACSQLELGANQAVAAEAPAAAATPEPAAPATPVGPLPTTPVDLSALATLSVEQLKQRHAQAIADGRIFAPAGNNAVEAELALRHVLGPEGGASYQTLLSDVAPNLVLLAESAISQGNLVERDRLVSLMEAIDPSLPSLQRLRETTAVSLNAPLAPEPPAIDLMGAEQAPGAAAPPTIAPAPAPGVDPAVAVPGVEPQVPPVSR